MASLKTQRIMEALAPAIPAHIMEEDILIRLPVKSKVRFRSVCKWWNSLFSDPKFIQNSFNRIHREEEEEDDDDDDYLILCNRTGTCSRSLSILSNHNLLESAINKLPYTFSSQFEDKISLVGSVNGLVCIADFKNCEFILWNPTIHWFKKILPPPSKEIMSHIIVSRLDSMCNKTLQVPPKEIWMSHMLGFGWDSLADDYKIITKPIYSRTAFVYSCKSGNWSNHQLVGSNASWCLPAQKPFPCVIVRGIPYWKTYSEVVKYDVTNNKIKLVDVTSINHNFNLINLNDHLAMVNYHPYKRAYVYCFDEQNSIWRKLYRVYAPLKKPMTMSFKYGGEIVYDGINSLYDPKSKKSKRFHCRLGTELVHCFSYTPTMLALEGMKPFRSSQKLDDGLSSYFDDDCLVETE